MGFGPRILAATAHAAVLAALCCSVALADDGYPAGGSSLPAVDGLNGKISGFGGRPAIRASMAAQDR